MAALILLRNPLAPHIREEHALEPGTQIIDWLTEHHPKGFGMPISVHVNGEEIAVDDTDYVIQPGDGVVIAVMPAEPISLTTIAVQLAITAVGMLAAYLATRFFQPKVPTGGIKGDGTSVYDVSSNQNAARLGEAIPVLYGTVLTTPDYISQPYTWFDFSTTIGRNELTNGVQYLDIIMCVGQGTIDIDDVYVGDTDVTTIPLDANGNSVVRWQAFTPSQHQSKMGTISTAMGADFFENVITSAEVGNQELPTVDSTAGFFATCKPGNKGKQIQIDIICPNGFYFVNAGDGDVQTWTRRIQASWVELDDNDNQIGTVYSQTFTVSSEGPSLTNTTYLASPIRRTFYITAAKSARWAVKLTRLDGAPIPQKGQTQMVWSGLKLIADNVTGTVYGNVTLLACRIKASQGLGAEAAVRVSVKATRRLAPPNGGSLARSTSGADAFADVYLDSVYGANRPRSELDTATLTSLRTKWASYQFNHVFRNRITVWEALQTITTPFAAEPAPIGAVMSVAQDGVKSIRSMLFTDANILDNSLSVSYSFDDPGAPDGVEIEYINPVDWKQSYTRYPTSSARPDKFTLPGCTSANHAGQYARLAWQRTRLQRKRVTFDTELEGLILNLGDRIGISHNVMKWGDGGLIIGVSGNVLTVDHALDWSGGTKQILLRRRDGSVTNAVTVTRGVKDFNVILPSAPSIPIDIDGDYDFTSFAFGTSTTLVRDFIVVAVRPTGENRVTVEAANYDTAIFTGAMPYLTS